MRGLPELRGDQDVLLPDGLDRAVGGGDIDAAAALCGCRSQMTSDLILRMRPADAPWRGGGRRCPVCAS